ncbi:MAG TPA: hypothetical protein EYN22_07475 [Nitrospinaceae bacterium]|nr:hypothetical protein [Nitrospinaceae bacterium]
MQKINPKKYGLSYQTTIFKIERGDVVIMKNRKSRIIMKDGYKILETARKIRKIEKSVKITLQTNAPMCSKTKRYLEKNVIAVALTE